MEDDVHPNAYLTDQEIEQAKREILEMYPIYKTDFDVSFPWVGCLCKVISRCFNGFKACVTLKRRVVAQRPRVASKKAGLDLAAMSNQMRIGMKKLVRDDIKQHEEKDASYDPYKELGFGLVAYKNLMESMITVFIILTCLMMPVIQIYHRGSAFEPNSLTIFGRYSVGNLGYSSV